jgi:hypothetical protein
MRAATFSSPRPVLAVRRTHPCPVPSDLVPPPKRGLKPLWALPAAIRHFGDAPPSTHHLAWATPQRQLNIHTQTRRPITDSISDATVFARPRPLALRKSTSVTARGNTMVVPIGNHCGPIAIS